MTDNSPQITSEKVTLCRNESTHKESAPGGYYQGLNERLYAALPAARRVLELGCASGRLGQRYKQEHPDACWVGVDINAKVVEVASTRLDKAYCLDLDEESLDKVGSGFDCIVFGDLIEHLKRPEQLLRMLEEIADEDAVLVCCVPNMCHISVLERMLGGDISYDSEGLLDRTHLRFYSQPALFKLLLDCGWLPDLQKGYIVGPENPLFARNLISSAEALQVPPSVAAYHLFSYQMVVRCKKRVRYPAAPVQPCSVIVAVSNESQLNLNILRSPGLSEMQAEVILVRNAASAADAFREGAQKATYPWRLLCHQDVYFPSRTGAEISSLLSGVSPQEAGRCILGFAGIALDGTVFRKAGLVIDRGLLLDFPGSAMATSLDEFCVAVHRDCAYTIDSDLGWHFGLQIFAFRRCTIRKARASARSRAYRFSIIP